MQKLYLIISAGALIYLARLDSYGLYLLIAISWVYASFKEKLIKPAIWSIILFMLGFAIMRLLKITSDGVPNLYYLSIFLLEIITAFIGFWLIKNK
tara:strand:- start:763 stop:1050 length:288 start_codon:yes stop_codon:yes gene_type:complete